MNPVIMSILKTGKSKCDNYKAMSITASNKQGNSCINKNEDRIRIGILG